ncbi:unnamed protein product [Soboliphyme baturini]|uniref:WD_REPEATS_REGION domain-containing protein n=1 Tax=Soboliphyme baturini TaxID=241478 RepID=A0A183IXY6_9BILA|nr:unnamed protein product [Soboliphyme baturini]
MNGKRGVKNYLLSEKQFRKRQPAAANYDRSVMVYKLKNCDIASNFHKNSIRMVIIAASGEKLFRASQIEPIVKTQQIFIAEPSYSRWRYIRLVEPVHWTTCKVLLGVWRTVRRVNQ